MNYKRPWVWQLLFFSLVGAYCLYYAPYGLNETDGGFLSGLAWQVLNGKQLYQDIVYVRPPLPVWMRALEIQCLPDHFAVLGERWIFYGKLALYSWMGAAILLQGAQRWQLAALGFVVSVHCYPAMAWHTVDGILFAVAAVYFLSPRSQMEQPVSFKRGLSRMYKPFLSGIFLFCALLCKQSFYPLLPFFTLYLFLVKEDRSTKAGWFFAAIALCGGLFFNYLHQNDLLAGYWQMTGASSSGGQALQHGILDYFRITPELALPSMVFVSPVVWWYWKGKNAPLALTSWLLWLSALVLSYAAITWLRQEHTVPFAQSRVMFWVCLAVLIAGAWKNHQPSIVHPSPSTVNRQPSTVHRSSFTVPSSSFLLLGISWCASVSWGYNLPILFATPWVWAGKEVTRVLQSEAGRMLPQFLVKNLNLVLLLALLLAFRVGHEFVYRDGRRSEMHVSMGAIFPQLSGIYSDRETADLYLDLKQLAARYGQNFKTLPAFPQANFLTQTPPPLPLDWVVNRETNRDNRLIFKYLNEKHPVIFVQKNFLEKIKTDPELEVTRRVLQNGKVLAETAHFVVIDQYDLFNEE